MTKLVITAGTTAARVVGDGFVSQDTVDAPDPFPQNPIWDDVLGNVREKTAGEIAADEQAQLQSDINAEAKRRIALLIPSDTDTRERNQRRASRVAYERAKQPVGDLPEPYYTWEAQMIALDNAIEGIVSHSNTITTRAELDAWKAE